MALAGYASCTVHQLIQNPQVLTNQKRNWNSSISSAGPFVLKPCKFATSIHTNQRCNHVCKGLNLLILGMVIPPLVGNLCNGYINPYFFGLMPIPSFFMDQNHGSLDPKPQTYPHISSISHLCNQLPTLPTCRGALSISKALIAPLRNTLPPGPRRLSKDFLPRAKQVLPWSWSSNQQTTPPMANSQIGSVFVIVVI